MATNMYTFHSEKSSRQCPASSVANQVSELRTPQHNQRVSYTPHLCDRRLGLGLGSGPLSAISRLTLDELDVSLVEETGSPNSLSPVTSPLYNTCFDKDAYLVRTCIKRPVSERSTASSGLTLRSSLLGSPTGNRDQLTLNTAQGNRTNQQHANIASQKPVQKEDDGPLKPFRSHRLRPIRQKTKNVMVSVTEHSCVMLEFIKVINGQEKALEVMKISEDGEKVLVYHPNGNEGYVIGNTPADLTDVSQGVEYHYTELPPKYLKRYKYAARFVRLVQSKTPKITMYTDQAKCMLMENSPEADFEAVFYEGGKVRQSCEGVRLTRSDGTTLHLPSSTDQPQDMAEEEAHIWNHAKQCHRRCLQLETLLESVQSKDCKGFSSFPVTMGRRPSHTFSKSQDASLCNWTHSPESTSIYSCSSNNQMFPQDVPQHPLSPPKSHVSSSTSSHSGSASSSIVHQVFVPQVGLGIQLANGVVLVQFIDGSELAIQPSPMLITYKDQNNKRTSYNESDQLPVQVCKLLDTLPMVMSQLQTAGSSSSQL